MAAKVGPIIGSTGTKNGGKIAPENGAKGTFGGLAVGSPRGLVLRLLVVLHASEIWSGHRSYPGSVASSLW